MSWGNPWMLLALLLPSAAAWLLRRMRDEVKPLWPAMRRVSITGSNHVLAGRPDTGARAYVIIAAIALGIIALARPQWGEHTEQSFSQSVEVIIALDLSRSMWTEDMPDRTSRLHAAKDLIDKLLNNLRGENVGLIVFAGTSFVQVPMSPDYQIIREFLPSLNPTYMPRGGSDYNRMLDSALEGFGDANDRDRYLIVLSDGESSSQGWEKKIPDLLKGDIHVVGIGFGTEKGAFIADQKGGYLTDKSGSAIVSRLAPATLQSLADRTAGRYTAAITLPNERAARKLIRDTVETGRAGRLDTSNANAGVDRFQWFLAPAALLALLSLAREFPRQARPRQVRPTVALGLALLTAVLAAPRLDARDDSIAGLQIKEVSGDDTTQRLRTIAAHLGQFGYEASGLELLVRTSIAYGAEERNQGKMPLNGVIHDALDAVHEGRKLAPQLSSWDGYESRLQDLMATLPNSARAEDSQKPDDDADDHKDDPPLLVKQKKARQRSDDVNREGGISKSDFTLGDLSADDNFAPQQPQGQPPAPQKKKNSRPVDTGALEDPRLAEARKNMASVVKADSPGRVHQLLEGDSKQQTNVGQDW